MSEPTANRRLVLWLCLGIAVVVAVIAGAISLLGGEQPPATGAAKVVPGDALLYLHLSTDRSRPAVKQALTLGRRFPDFPVLTGSVAQRVGDLLHGPADGVWPWLGKEAAFALLNTTTSTAGSLVVLDVGRPALAHQYVREAGAVAAGRYDGTPLLQLSGGTELAFVSHYLVAGQPASVQASIEAANRRTQSLADSPTYQSAVDDEPAGRVLDIYAPVSGVRRVLGPRSGLLGSLGVLLDQPALTAAAISLSAVPGGAAVDVHESLDPAAARLSGPAARFSPTLPDVVPAQGALLLDVSGLAQWAPRVLRVAASAGVAGRVQPLLGRLGTALSSEGVDVHRVTAIFSGESALFISPPVAGSASGSGAATSGATSGAAGTVAGAGGPASRNHQRSPAPALMIVTRTSDQQSASELLANVEAPLAQLFPPPASGPGQAPEFTDVPVDGITVHQLALAPGLELDYAVFRGLVVLSTSLQAIAGLAQRSQPLSDDPLYRSALIDRPDPLTSLVFLDFRALLRLGEQTGLLGRGRLAARLGDLEKVSSIGLTTTRQESDTNAELFIHIS